MRASGSTILWHVTIAAAIVISRNEILTALEDENDSSSQPRGSRLSSASDYASYNFSSSL